MSDSEDDVHASGGDDGGSPDDGGAGSDAGAESAGESGSADDAGAAERPVSKKRKRGPVALQPEQLAEFEAAEKRTGVVYISRVPPFMKPVKVRHLLEQHAEIKRIYLAPEDPAAYKRRVKAGGNKKPQWTEGWVEFAHKRDAKAVAALLNSTPVEPAGAGRGFYASDLWTLKYLKHFKWHHLTEKIAYEQRIRAQKLRAQLAQAKKEAEHYVGRAEQAKSLAAMEARKRKAGAAATDDGDAPSKKKQRGGNGGASSAAAAASGGGLSEADRANIRRRFKQRAPLPDAALGTGKRADA